MATLISFPLTKIFLSFSLLFILLLSCFLKKSYGFDGRKATNIQSHYHTVPIISLLPASVCSTPSSVKGSNKGESTIKVIHQHGPCDRLGRDKAATTTPSLSEVFSHDQSRVEWIQGQLAPNRNTNKINEKKVDIPAKSGRSLGSGNYIVTVALGTPAKTLSLIFDTGSDLTWTQCQPCVRSCYQQQDPIFNPSTSSTYSNVSCSSAQCSQLSSATGNNPGCSAGTTCLYLIQYGDQSFTVGFFSSDKLTISANDVFPNFLFGCGQNNQGLFGNTAGLLGLGRDPLSVVSQTSEKYGKYFSYCLPSTSSSTGHLTLGKSGVSRNAKFTPFASSKGASFYFIDIIAISVGGRQLPISQAAFKTAGSIIDSGTVITRLPPAAYSTMSSTFKQLMTKYPSAPAFSILDTCYNLGNFTTVTIPAIAFMFDGNVKVDMDPSGILVAVSSSRVCLAFAGNNNANDIGIFGNTQQKTLEVVYDVAGGNLGFSPGGCD